MGQKRNPRRVAENEAMAKGVLIRSSPQKLNLVAQTIRGLKAEKARAELKFSHKRVAGQVLKVLDSAIANAENNHDLDIDQLVVAKAYVGRKMALRRFNARGRGRMARILKPFSEITIVVREAEEAA